MSDLVLYLCPHDLDKRRERCLMCNPQDALDSRTAAMYAANEAANRYKTDADRLAEALGSDDDGYCRECRRMVWQWYERDGYPTKGEDNLDLHADDCVTGGVLLQHYEALRQHDATTKNETDAPLHNPSGTATDVQPCDCGTVDCAKAALEYEYSARAHGEAPQDRNDADPDIGSPEMPAPGYDAQTRHMPVALAPGQYHHDREDRP